MNAKKELVKLKNFLKEKRKISIEDPSTNPISALAHHVSKKLLSREIDIQNIELIIDILSKEQVKSRVHSLKKNKTCDIQKTVINITEKNNLKTFEQYKNFWAATKIGTVFTAHPTESARQSTLKKLYEIGKIISENKSDNLIEINNLITQLWYTREIRSIKPNPIDEVKTLLYYLNILYTDVHNEINNTLYENNISQKNIVRFGTWIGGDRDGNPYVTLKVTEEALRIYSNQIIQIYKDKIIELSERFII